MARYPADDPACQVFLKGITWGGGGQGGPHTKFMGVASLCFLLGVTWYGQVAAWRLARGDQGGVGEDTRPLVYAHKDWLVV